MDAEQALFTAPALPPDIEPDMRVGFILSPRFTLTPFAAFIDCLRHAADEADFSRQVYCHWKIVAPTLDPVTASCGVEVRPHALLPEDETFDHLVVIGGLLPASLEHPEETLRYLCHAYAHNTIIVGLCTASFVLAKAGLLENRRCALHFEHVGQFKQMFPRARPEADQSFVNDGEIITSPGDTPASLSRKIRLAHGHWLLVNTTRTVTQIAADCGYADGAHFCRWFGSVYGETPSRFRNRRRQI